MNQQQFARLNRLVGSWTTEATHPALPGVVVHGTVNIEWLEGERFLIQRSRTDHPEFPDAMSVIGNMAHALGDAAEADKTAESKLSMHYFDSRGVFRSYDATIEDSDWRLSREDPTFPQRFAGKLSSDGNTLTGTWELREGDGPWRSDLRITYRRLPGER
jgi:hypothetical protein